MISLNWEFAFLADVPPPYAMTEAEFRWEHNQDAMAVKLSAEGIHLLLLTSANWKITACRQAINLAWVIYVP